MSRFTTYKPQQESRPPPVDINRTDTRSQHQMGEYPERVFGQRYNRPSTTQSNMYHRAWGQPEVNDPLPPLRSDGSNPRAWYLPEGGVTQFPPLRDDGPVRSTMDSNQHRDSFKDLTEALASVMYTHLCTRRL